MIGVMKYSYPTMLLLLVALSHQCAGQKETSSVPSVDDQDAIILSRLDLARLSRIRIDTRQVPLQRKCAIYVKELRHMVGDKEAAATGDSELLNQVVRVLGKRKLPFSNTQPVPNDLLECLKAPPNDGLYDDDESALKREVIASPPYREPLTDPNPNSSQGGIERALNEFKEVKNNVKDFGQDLYLKPTADIVRSHQQADNANTLANSNVPLHGDGSQKQNVGLNVNPSGNPERQLNQGGSNGQGLGIDSRTVSGSGDPSNIGSDVGSTKRADASTIEPGNSDDYENSLVVNSRLSLNSNTKADDYNDSRGYTDPVNDRLNTNVVAPSDHIPSDPSEAHRGLKEDTIGLSEPSGGSPPAPAYLDSKYLSNKGAVAIPIIRNTVLNAEQKIVDFANGDKDYPGDLRNVRPADDSFLKPQYVSPGHNDQHYQDDDDNDHDEPEAPVPSNKPVKIEIHYANNYHKQISDDSSQFSHSNQNSYQHHSIKRVLDDPEEEHEVEPPSSSDDDDDDVNLVFRGPDEKPRNFKPLGQSGSSMEQTLEKARFETLKAQYEAVSKREEQYLAQLKANKAIVARQEQLISELSENGKTDKKELTDPAKMASLMWEKLDPDEDQLTRCYRYYLLYSYPKKITKATVKTIANLSLRVPNIESYNQLVITPYSDLMRRTSDTLVSSSNKRAVKVGTDMQECMSQSVQPSYRNNWQYNAERQVPAFGRSPFATRFARIPSIPPMPPMPGFNHESPNYQFY